jgi:hypothetical protein
MIVFWRVYGGCHEDFFVGYKQVEQQMTRRAGVFNQPRLNGRVQHQ